MVRNKVITGLIVTTIVPHLSIQTLPLGVTTTQGTCIDQG